MKQKILTMITLRGDLRAKVDAWGWEDGDFVQLDKEIGLSGSGKSPPSYKTPLHAIGDGWRLMAPPVFVPEYAKPKDSPVVSAWEWWLEK